MGRTRTGNGRTTCVEIARMASVGVSTVSRVLNRPDAVSDVLRARVNRAIEATNYQPSSAARMMASRRFETVGVICESEVERTHYFADFIQGVSHRLTETQYRLAVATVHEETDAVALADIPMLKRHSVDGLILDLHLIAGNLDRVLPTLGLPYVLVNPPLARAYDAIKPDDPAAARLAVQHLLSRGHRRIGYLPSVDPNAHSSHDDRLRGYLEAMNAAGRRAPPLHEGLSQQMDVAALCARIRYLVESEGCTALIAYDGVNAARVLRACYEMNLVVPDRISLMACDDSPVLEQSVVPVSCVGFDRSAMGHMAFDMVMERVRDNGRDIPTRVLSGVLHERESVRPPT